MVDPRAAQRDAGALAGAERAHGAGAGPADGTDVARATPGAGGEPGAQYGPYLGSLRQRIQEALRYPASARRRGIAGTVTLEVRIEAGGAITDVAVVESSSHAVLDAAAVDAVRGLRAMPLPADLPRRELRVRVPVVFQLR